MVIKSDYVQIKSNGTFEAQTVHGDALNFFVKERSGSRTFTNVEIPQSEVYLLERIYRHQKFQWTKTRCR